MSIRERYIKKQNDKSEISISPRFPKIIKIDTCNTCNLSCVFCPQSKFINKIGNIDDLLCRKVIKDAYDCGAREIALSSTGEPLLNPKLEEYIIYAKELGYTYVFFNTNGVLLNNKRAKTLIATGIDSIKISINAGRKDTYNLVHGADEFDTVINNLKELKRIRDELKSSCKISVSYVAIKQTVKESDLLKEIISDSVDDYMVLNANRRGGSISEIDENLYNGDDEFSYTFPCSQMFNNIYISAEGYVNICCQDFENVGVIADLNKTYIHDAWNCEEFRKYRESYLKKEWTGTLCDNCMNNTDKHVKPLCKDKAYFDISEAKKKDLDYRIQKLIKDYN